MEEREKMVKHTVFAVPQSADSSDSNLESSLHAKISQRIALRNVQTNFGIHEPGGCKASA